MQLLKLISWSKEVELVLWCISGSAEGFPKTGQRLLEMGFFAPTRNPTDEFSMTLKEVAVSLSL